ncbi:hypothetical protein BG011_001829 [Mortierella polycephala]|uniref:Uncharacterized protein n=1 Tax=Mortierella polycephala TaxID=41804 RepID=A0A9P6Q4Q0_9FUNG|nr:hypothetical protein BG011_001829 [Mortierella polycephala]
MRFSQYLHEEIVPEWRKAYIDYKQGKRYVKAVASAVEDMETIQHLSASAHDDEDDERRALVLSIDPAPTNYQAIKRYQTFSKDDNQPNRGAQSHGYMGLSDQESGSASFYPPGNGPSGQSNSMATHMSHTARTQGTHIMKSLTRRFTGGNHSRHTKRSRVICLEEDSIDNVIDQLLIEEKDFFKFLDQQLEKVDTFYQEKELEAVTKVKVLKQQLYVADEWKRLYDERMARVEAEGGWDWTRMRSGFGSLMLNEPSVTDVKIRPVQPVFNDVEQSNPKVRNNEPTTPDTERTIIDMNPGQALRPQESQQIMDEQNLNMAATDPIAYKNQLLLEDGKSHRQYLNHGVARTRIKAALYEFYRSLEMLKSYKVLNDTGFTKIIKKFDKAAGWRASKAFKTSKMQPCYFMKSVVLENLIKETEDLFIERFENGHRQRGMAKLRIPDSRRRSHHAASARIGIYFGLASLLLIQGISAALSEETRGEIPYWDSLLLVYAGMFLTTLFACLFGVNMYVWARSKINYKFIFEFDPRDNLDYHQFFELPMFFMLVLCLGIYLDFGSHLTTYIATAYYPMIIMVVTLFILICPLPVFNRGARKWFIVSIGRILISGYVAVEFRDFFIADELNSLSYSIEQFEFAMCAYSQQWENLGTQCVTSRLWITPFLTALPPWFRLLQCLRRYRDTLEWFPHLFNAAKYSCSLLNVFVYFSYRFYGGIGLKLAWIMVSTITSLYTFSWDVYMDWGLFRFGKHGGGANGNPFLRAELVYSQKWVYYMAIMCDLLARFSWVMRLVPTNINTMILAFSLALVEVLRRWMWNFFRLENEHLNNCGQFRAIKDIPLPFHIRIEGESDDEEYETDEESEEDDQTNDTEIIPTQGVQDGALDIDGQSSAVPILPKPRGLGRTSSSVSQSGLGGSSNAETTGSSVHRETTTDGARQRQTRKKRHHLPTEPRIGLERSNTFVEDAMTEAGYADEQRQHLNEVNKFYDRRDFETRVIDVAEELLRSYPRTNAARTTHSHRLHNEPETYSSGGSAGPS